MFSKFPQHQFASSSYAFGATLAILQLLCEYDLKSDQCAEIRLPVAVIQSVLRLLASACEVILCLQQPSLKNLSIVQLLSHRRVSTSTRSRGCVESCLPGAILSLHSALEVKMNGSGKSLSSWKSRWLSISFGMVSRANLHLAQCFLLVRSQGAMLCGDIRLPCKYIIC